MLPTRVGIRRLQMPTVTLVILQIEAEYQATSARQPLHADEVSPCGRRRVNPTAPAQFQYQGRFRRWRAPAMSRQRREGGRAASRLVAGRRRMPSITEIYPRCGRRQSRNGPEAG